MVVLYYFVLPSCCVIILPFKNEDATEQIRITKTRRIPTTDFFKLLANRCSNFRRCEITNAGEGCKWGLSVWTKQWEEREREKKKTMGKDWWSAPTFSVLTIFPLLKKSITRSLSLASVNWLGQSTRGSPLDKVTPNGRGCCTRLHWQRTHTARVHVLHQICIFVIKKKKFSLSLHFKDLNIFLKRFVRYLSIESFDVGYNFWNNLTSE